MRTLQTLVIGAGQAGMAAGWHLAREHVDFLILEAGSQPGGAWRHYYDSLELFSPARYSALPGLPFPGAPGHYPHRDEVVAYLDDYARHFRLPIRTGQSVVQVIRHDGGFETITASGEHYRSQSVVVASGSFGQPWQPRIDGQEGFRGQLLHSADYRRPEDFAGRRVLVVGSANSAVQIAVELATAAPGAQVTLASRTPVRFVPKRFLGLDFHFWVKWTGLEKTRWLSDQSTPVLDDGTYRRALASGRVPRRAMFTRFTQDGVVWPDGTQEVVDAVIMATGFRPDTGFLRELDVHDYGRGLAQHNGIADRVPGLYFIGFAGQRNFASATLRGVGEDAAYLMPSLLAHLRAPQPAALTGNTPGAAS